MNWYWIEITQIKPSKALKYKVHTENPLIHAGKGAMSADTVAVYKIEGYSTEDAICRVMRGDGKLVI